LLVNSIRKDEMQKLKICQSECDHHSFLRSHQDEGYKILYLEFCMFNLMFDFENTIANFKNRI